MPNAVDKKDAEEHKSVTAHTIMGLFAVADRVIRLERENKRLKSRVSAIESILHAWMTGMVKIQGDNHLLECEKRNDENSSCTCGSTPLRSKPARKGKRHGNAKRAG